MQSQSDLRADRGGTEGPERPVRADARRNIDALLRTAMEVFRTAGVDAPVRDIARKAGVGVGTVYRHFPQRSDLIAAVFRQEIDACADAAPAFAAAAPPGEALTRWIDRYVDFILAKRGLAVALHSGDPAYESLPDYFHARLKPALAGLLDAAVAAGAMRGDVTPGDLMWSVGSLCAPGPSGGTDHVRTMVGAMMEGLRTDRSPPAGGG